MGPTPTIRRENWTVGPNPIRSPGGRSTTRVILQRGDSDNEHIERGDERKELLAVVQEIGIDHRACSDSC